MFPFPHGNLPFRRIPPLLLPISAAELHVHYQPSSIDSRSPGYLYSCSIATSLVTEPPFAHYEEHQSTPSNKAFHYSAQSTSHFQRK